MAVARINDWHRHLAISEDVVCTLLDVGVGPTLNDPDRQYYQRY